MRNRRQEKPSDPQSQSAAIEREKRLYKMNYWGLVCLGRRSGAIFDYSNMCQVGFLHVPLARRDRDTAKILPLNV